MVGICLLYCSIADFFYWLFNNSRKNNALVILFQAFYCCSCLLQPKNSKYQICLRDILMRQIIFQFLEQLQQTLCILRQNKNFHLCLSRGPPDVQKNLFQKVTCGFNLSGKFLPALNQITELVKLWPSLPVPRNLPTVLLMNNIGLCKFPHVLAQVRVGFLDQFLKALPPRISHPACTSANIPECLQPPERKHHQCQVPRWLGGRSFLSLFSLLTQTKPSLPLYPTETKVQLSGLLKTETITSWYLKGGNLRVIFKGKGPQTGERTKQNCHTHVGSPVIVHIKKI